MGFADTAPTPRKKARQFGAAHSVVTSFAGGSLNVSRIFIRSPPASRTSPSRGGLLFPYAGQQSERVHGRRDCGHARVGKITYCFVGVVEAERTVDLTSERSVYMLDAIICNWAPAGLAFVICNRCAVKMGKVQQLKKNCVLQHSRKCGFAMIVPWICNG